MSADHLFIEILKAHFEERLGTNARYSLRAFARDLSVSPGVLSGLFNGKKGISEKTAILMCRCLGLTGRERSSFLLSVQRSYSRSPEKKRIALIESEKLEQRKRTKTVLKGDALDWSANWIHLAILELCDLPQCTHQIGWFAKMLKVNELVAERAVKTLLNSGQLKLVSGRYIQTAGETTTEMDVPSSVIRKFHSEIIDQAKISLSQEDVKNREFLAVTMAFSRLELTEAKEMIRSFQEEFCERFYRSSRKKKDSVYQLSTQLFPLTKTK